MIGEVALVRFKMTKLPPTPIKVIAFTVDHLRVKREHMFKTWLKEWSMSFSAERIDFHTYTWTKEACWEVSHRALYKCTFYSAGFSIRTEKWKWWRKLPLSLSEYYYVTILTSMHPYIQLNTSWHYLLNVTFFVPSYIHLVTEPNQP